MTIFADTTSPEVEGYNYVPPQLFLELVIFLVFSAFFSCAETAVFSLSKVQVIKIENSKRLGSASLSRLLRDPKNTLNSILLGNLFVNIGASMTGGVIAESYIKGEPFLAFIAGAAGVTLIILFFGEILPKTIGLEKAETMSLIFAPILRYIFLIISPFNKVLSIVVGFFYKIFKLPPENPQNTLTEEELKALLQLSDVRAVLEEDEKEMIESVIELKETTVEDIMTPRTDIAAFPLETSKQEIIEYIKSKGHTRLVIYDEDIDHIAGILLAKDVILYPEKDIKDLLREPQLIPTKKPLSDLLNELKQSTIHMAIVIDEFGGTAGVVTLNDLLEEIVGEMRDKKEITEESIIKIDVNKYKVLGKTETWEFEDKFHVRLPEDMGRTIGGLVMNTLGSVPDEGESASTKFGTFTVAKMDENRIAELIFIPSNEILSNEEKNNI